MEKKMINIDDNIVSDKENKLSKSLKADKVVNTAVKLGAGVAVGAAVTGINHDNSEDQDFNHDAEASNIKVEHPEKFDDVVAGDKEDYTLEDVVEDENFDVNSIRLEELTVDGQMSGVHESLASVLNDKDALIGDIEPISSIGSANSSLMAHVDVDTPDMIEIDSIDPISTNLIAGSEEIIDAGMPDLDTLPDPIVADHDPII